MQMRRSQLLTNCLTMISSENKDLSNRVSSGSGLHLRLNELSICPSVNYYDCTMQTFENGLISLRRMEGNAYDLASFSFDSNKAHVSLKVHFKIRKQVNLMDIQEDRVICDFDIYLMESFSMVQSIVISKSRGNNIGVSALSHLGSKIIVYGL